MALSPGERIDLKKQIAETLGNQEWRDIDLTLSEFGFPTEETWDGSPSGYVVEMLATSKADGALVELASYLRPTAGPLPQEATDRFADPGSPWSDGGFRLFISHVSEYAEHAGALREELLKRSIDAFVAHDSIEPTEEWQDVILTALGSCDACLALLTPGFSESSWTDQEVGWAMARKLLVIPVEFGQTPYGFLGRYQAQPVKKGQAPADIALGVFELLVRKQQSRDAMARALVARWASTNSWDAARENYGFLKMIPDEAWNQQLVTDVWEAHGRVHDLKTANINWKDSGEALDDLLGHLPYSKPSLSDQLDDDIPF